MIKCKKHPKYKGVGYPWSKCPACLMIYTSGMHRDTILEQVRKCGARK